jgi:hypothetical protein
LVYAPDYDRATGNGAVKIPAGEQAQETLDRYLADGYTLEPPTTLAGKPHQAQTAQAPQPPSTRHAPAPQAKSPNPETNRPDPQAQVQPPGTGTSAPESLKVQEGVESRTTESAVDADAADPHTGLHQEFQDAIAETRPVTAPPPPKKPELPADVNEPFDTSEFPAAVVVDRLEEMSSVPNIEALIASESQNEKPRRSILAAAKQKIATLTKPSA